MFAYHIKGEKSQNIVFAYTEIQARAIGSNILDEEEEYIDVSRAPQFDNSYYFGRVPDVVLIDSGWYMPCRECETLIDSDYYNYEEDCEMDWKEMDSHVFCSQKCFESYRQRREVNKIVNSQARAVLRSQFPLAYKISFLGGSGEIFFDKHKYARWSLDDPQHVWVSPYWRDDWMEFSDRCKAARMARSF